jgi:hypothetical protein
MSMKQLSSPTSLKRSQFSVRVDAMHEINIVIVDALSHTGASTVPHITCSFIASRIQGCLVVWISGGERAESYGFAVQENLRPG